MKMVKNIAIVACAASFMFASVSFHMGNNYSSLDAATPTVLHHTVHHGPLTAQQVLDMIQSWHANDIWCW